MNQYRRGSTTFVSSRLGSACVRAHLKVENPVLLRTIYILIYCRPASCLSPCNATAEDKKLRIWPHTKRITL